MEQPKNNFKVIAEKKNARVILPNMLTLIGVCIGLTSIRFALSGEFGFAVIAIILAAIIDGLDGRIARLIKGTSKVGKELDSLTDMISFGVAPAFIMYFWKLNTLGRFGWLVCLIYVICVALRLARFNVNSNQNPSWKDNFFEGVPSPAGGILVLTPLIIIALANCEAPSPYFLSKINKFCLPFTITSCNSLLYSACMSIISFSLLWLDKAFNVP